MHVDMPRTLLPSRRVIDITGLRFSCLKVIRFDDTFWSRQARWVCKCDCGNKLTVLGIHLRNGNTKSCGCLRVDKAKELANSPAYKKMVSERIAAFNRTDRAKRFRSKSSKNNWKNPSIRKQMTTGMLVRKAEIFRSKPPTGFERRCYELLDSWKVKYRRQHPICEAGTIVDAYVPAIKTCIYFDSEYWHSREDNIRRDKRIRGKLVQLGYRVAVIRCNWTGRVINGRDLCKVKKLVCPKFCY